MQIFFQQSVIVLLYFLCCKSKRQEQNEQLTWIKDRLLSESQISAQPIRITFEIPESRQIEDKEIILRPNERLFLNRIMSGSIEFLKKLIKIIPRKTPIKTQKGYSFCRSSEYPDSLKTDGVGIADSDMHILVIYERDQSNSHIASASWCELDPHPIISHVLFNLPKLNMETTSDWEFQTSLSVCLHEIIHILGFSQYLFRHWVDPVTKQPISSIEYDRIVQKVTRWGNSNVIRLSSRYVLETVKRYFNCPSIEGMYLENQGAEGSKGSHWETDLISNEIMTSSLVEAQFQLSEFTLALLRDTGYFEEVNSNLANQMFWGKNKGCDFYNKACNSTNSFQEFSSNKVFNSNDQVCDYSEAGYSRAYQQFFSQCIIVDQRVDQICGVSPKLQTTKPKKFGSPLNSHCFHYAVAVQRELVHDIKLKPKCFHVECAHNDSSVHVLINDEGKFIVCEYEGQQIEIADKKSNKIDILQCPSDFSKLCAYPIYCENHCNQRGICIKGSCHCFEGWTGKSCSKYCRPPQSLLFQNRCVKKCGFGTYKNPDNTCQNSCPLISYYANQQTNECQLCHSSCLRCKDETQNSCSACNFGFELIDKTCVSNFCEGDCSTCKSNSPQSCITCKPGYTLNKERMTCFPQCHSSCKTCTGSHDSLSCSSCHPGYFLKKNKCIICAYPCQTCDVTPHNCLSCSNSTNFEYELESGNKCQLKCDKTCQSCSQSNNPYACLSCYRGTYLNQNKCQPCISPCLDCLNEVECLTCLPDFIFDKQSMTCNPICHNSCNSCHSPKDEQACQSCFPGSYLVKGKCMQCDKPCEECFEASNKCLKCPRDYFLDQNTSICYLIDCPSLCIKCTKNQGQVTCLECQQGTVKVLNECIKCAGMCASCDKDPYFCNSCFPGYSLSSDNKCETNCSPPCQECGIDSCISCLDGYFLDMENKCIPCEKPCLTCDKIQSSCTSCEIGYSIDPNTQTCNFDCYENCIECNSLDSQQVCIECQTGYFLSPQNQNCEECTLNCMKCTKREKCDVCKSGFYWNIDVLECIVIQITQAIQYECPTNCKECNRESCLTCSENFVLNEQNNCIKEYQDQIGQCSNFCLSCFGEEYYYCTSCNSNRFLQIIDQQQQSGMCICLENTTDFNDVGCENSFISFYLRKTTIGSYLTSLIISQIASFLLKNPNEMIGLIYFSQQISYFQFFNSRMPLGFDNSLQVLESSNLNIPRIREKLESPLQSNQANNYPEFQIQISPKVQLNSQQISFSEKTSLNILLNIIFWALQLILPRFSVGIKSLGFCCIKYFCSLKVRITFFLLTSPEIFFQAVIQIMKRIQTSEDKNEVIIASIGIAYYLIGFLIFILAIIRRKWIEKRRNPIEQNENRNSNRKQQDRNNFICCSCAQLLRKGLSEMILLFVYEIPLFQSCALLLINVIFAGFLLLKQPLNQTQGISFFQLECVCILAQLLYTAVTIWTKLSLLFTIAIIGCIILVYAGFTIKSIVVIISKFQQSKCQKQKNSAFTSDKSDKGQFNHQQQTILDPLPSPNQFNMSSLQQSSIKIEDPPQSPDVTRILSSKSLFHPDRKKQQLSFSGNKYLVNK